MIQRGVRSGPGGRSSPESTKSGSKGFELATIGEFSSLKGHYTAWGSSAQVKTTALRTNPELKPVRSTTASLVPLLPVQRFRVRYFTGPNFQIGENNCLQIIAPGCDRSRVDSFICVDGAFRFIGPGDYPFWESCSTNDTGLDRNNKITALQIRSR
jgi:hypothetical protein